MPASGLGSSQAWRIVARFGFGESDVGCLCSLVESDPLWRMSSCQSLREDVEGKIWSRTGPSWSGRGSDDTRFKVWSAESPSS